MKLKTLKDLENGFKVVGIRELKQEAIKWAKKNIKSTKSVGDYEERAIGLSDWQEFFNITEEDLE